MSKLAYNRILIFIVQYTLAGIFIHSAASKLADYYSWLGGFSNIDFLQWDAMIYFGYALPFIELIAAVLLLVARTIKIGAIISSVLFLIFTVYLSIKIYLDDRTKCICGGIFTRLTDSEHIVVNIILCIASLYLVRIHQLQNSDMSKMKAQSK